jgi:hypothetical protein
MLPFVLSGQDTIKKICVAGKHQIVLKAGVTYKNFIGAKYMEITTPSYPYNPTERQYDGFTKMPTPGFQAGVLWRLTIYRNISLSAGLLYCLRKDTYEGNIDTVKKYHTQTSIHQIIKYEYTYNNIELSVLIGYRIHHFNLMLGVDFAFFSYVKSRYTYIPDPANNSGVSGKTFYDFDPPVKFYPTFQISYDVKIKKVLFSPFMGVDFGTDWAYHLQCGISFAFPVI